MLFFPPSLSSVFLSLSFSFSHVFVSLAFSPHPKLLFYALKIVIIQLHLAIFSFITYVPRTTGKWKEEMNNTARKENWQPLDSVISYNSCLLISMTNECSVENFTLQQQPGCKLFCRRPWFRRKSSIVHFKCKYCKLSRTSTSGWRGVFPGTAESCLGAWKAVHLTSLLK